MRPTSSPAHTVGDQAGPSARHATLCSTVQGQPRGRSGWGPDGYIEVLAASRGERARAEPVQAIEVAVGVFFGDDEE